MIVCIRGTNGSGKSVVVKKFMEQMENIKPIYGVLGPKRPEAYEIVTPEGFYVYVLGPYHIACGGCDAVQPYDRVLELFDKYVFMGDLLMEGLIIKYGRLGAKMEDHGKDAINMFLNTSVEDCIASVKKRRKKAGNEKPFNPANLIKTHKTFQNIEAKIRRERIMRVISISRDDAVHKLVGLLA